MKKFIGAIALAGMIVFAGCDTSEDTMVEEPVLEGVTPVPVITEPPVVAPAMPDTATIMMDTATADSAVPSTTTP